MNNANFRNRLKDLEKQLNQIGFFKAMELRCDEKRPGFSYAVLFIRYEQYSSDVNTTIEKINKKIHHNLIAKPDGRFELPKKLTESPYCFIDINLDSISIYDILPSTELSELFSNLSYHKRADTPLVHSFNSAELRELTAIIAEYQELLCDMAQ